ncbi:DUF6436 domain-containing protein [Neptunicella sp. SCSIO 80796]|uniref:DUF6436 domain-containing protein n=1 Tax=Neptunicella plasticusilytica TaxID=3117012 RepID=UPI003A4DA82D
MPTLNSPLPRWHYLLFVVWLTSVVIGACYFIKLRLVEFDPDGKLANADSAIFVANIAHLLQLHPDQLSNSIIHFRQRNCRCSTYSSEHTYAIDLLASKDSFTILHKWVNHELSTMVPATPAIMIVGNNSQLVYFGPYSTGLDCSANNSLVDTVLQNYRLGFNPKLIHRDAVGCYCQTSALRQD